MKLHIPEIGDKLRLIEPWAFRLHAEHRNLGIYERMGWSLPGWSELGMASHRIKLPKDTVLKVDRIYIRKGGADFSSLTFNITDCPGIPQLAEKKGPRRRFWAKLEDCNLIEYEVAE